MFKSRKEGKLESRNVEKLILVQVYPGARRTIEQFAGKFISLARLLQLRHDFIVRMSPSLIPDKTVFNKEKHISYWLRCLKTFLPAAYISNDSNRVTLASFIVSALDLLGVLEEKTTSKDRAQFVDWIYHCQHPGGGFRAFTGTIVGKEGEANQSWDPANIGATLFALTALLVLGDDLERVKRKECLDWIAGLQWDDGSFGEVLDGDGNTEGGRDVRFSMCSASIRWILRGEGSDVGGTAKDIDVDKMVDYIKSSRVTVPLLGDRDFS